MHVRDNIHHSRDYKDEITTYKASDVLKYKTGWCYAKSHLWAALLRAKTGWEGRYGWYVGYVETKNDVWFFAMNIDTKSKDDLPKRKAITLETLKLKGIIY